MVRTAVRSRQEPSLLDIAWPEPLVTFEQVMTHTPWLVPPRALLAYAPPRLIDVTTLVTSQENACRFCYGAQRAGMRFAGYSEEQITDLERDVELADELTRDVVLLARKLAKSNPRPVREELLGLERHGLDPRAVAEIVFAIASTCYANRIGTFLALPPERSMERLAESWGGRLLGTFLSVVGRHRIRNVGPVGPEPATGLFAPLISQLPNAPIVSWFARLADNCFRPGALPRATKLLILAVVARTLSCRFCEDAARTELGHAGLSAQGFESVMVTLAGPDVSPRDRRLLDWARETVHYETRVIQKRTRALAGEVGLEVLLEAVGAAAVSNTAVRLAMLLK